jgi:Spy/CpxP family protein refolding chaperone
MSVGAIGVAQVTTERPLRDAAEKLRERLQDGQAKVLVVSIQDIDLSDEQEAQLAAIRKEYRPKNETYAKELKTLVTDEVDQIRNVFTPEQRPKIKEIVKERKEFREESLAHKIAGLKKLDLTEGELAKIAAIRKEYRPRTEEIEKRLDSLLSAEQKTARNEAIKTDKSRREVLRAINPTSAQLAELQSIAKELKDVVGNEVAKIRAVLTAEQKETLQDLRAERREMVRDRVAHQIANLKDLDLTDEQKEKLMNIRQEFRPKIQETGNNLRNSLSEEIGKIVAVLKPAGVVAERPERVK